jgi:hypothetical protein
MTISLRNVAWSKSTKVGVPAAAAQISMWHRIGLSILSFVIYASAVLSLHQERHSGWFVEAAYSLPAAVSHSVYRTPLGMINPNVQAVFQEIFREEMDNRISVREALARTAAGDLPADHAVKTTTDGNGVGYPIFASLAMQLFGLHLSGLIYAFLLLIGVSTVVFISRFQDDRLFMVPLLFFALTLVLLSPLTSDPEGVDQCPIGGIRYFTVAGILPAFHILFELTDRSRPGANVAIRNFVLLGLQILMFAFVVLVRSSVGYLLGPIVLAAMHRIWANWRNPAELGRILGKTGLTVLAGITFVSIIAASVPDYVKTGRLFGNFWHRTVVGLGRHPDWPFGNLREVYNCMDVFPGGLTEGGDDRDGQCIFWSSYPPARARELPDAEINAYTYGGIYERVLRSAVLNIALSYPRQMLELYVYYKTAMIFGTLRDSVYFDLSAPTVLTLMVLQCVVFVAFVVWGAYRGSRQLTPRAGIVFVLFVFSLLPLYAAWSNLATAIDSIVFMYASAAVVFGVLVQAIVEQIFRVSKCEIHSA